MRSEIDHPEYQNRLRLSRESNLRVAGWLRRQGYAICLDPERDTPSASVWRDYSDRGDIKVIFDIESKQRDFHFTGRDDWPHPDLIVCSCASFDRLFPKPYAYIHLNQAATHLALVKVSTHRFWEKRLVEDRRRKDDKAFNYCCPLSLVKFAAMETATLEELFL